MAEQGSPEWHQQRLGKVTASGFHKVMTDSRTKDPLSVPARKYMGDLATEKLTLIPQGVVSSKATDWGHEHEDAAIRCYEAAEGLDPGRVERVGFFERPDLPGVGCSPDGLIGQRGQCGGVEAKCPFDSRNHRDTWLGGVCPKEHLAQVQGSMWVCEREWWDFVSFDPRFQDLKMVLFRVRVYRDKKYIDNLAFKVKNFLDLMGEEMETLNERLNN